tara:strand:+ start:153 stop:323 length:171 start_codon:yes stop_codon:yes gene_type:complete
MGRDITESRKVNIAITTDRARLRFGFGFGTQSPRILDVVNCSVDISDGVRRSRLSS